GSMFFSGALTRFIIRRLTGQVLLNRLSEHVKEIATIERQPKLEGKNMVMVLAPRQEIRQEAKQEQ
ncbi:MAG: hypothetical protein ACPLRH_07570, partial [Desulfotomaculales bacterium]